MKKHLILIAVCVMMVIPFILTAPTNAVSQTSQNSIVRMKNFPATFTLRLDMVSKDVPTDQIDSVKKIICEVCNASKIPIDYKLKLYFDFRYSNRAVRHDTLAGYVRAGEYTNENGDKNRWIELSQIPTIWSTLKNLDRRLLIVNGRIYGSDPIYDPWLR